MNLRIRQDIDRDIWNWQNAVSSTGYGVEWKRFLPSSITTEAVMDSRVLRAYLVKEFYSSGVVEVFIQWLSSHVNSAQISRDLELLMGKTFRPVDIAVLVTTFHRAPYDLPDNSFFSILRDRSPERAITSIYHELMHFLFHWHYWQIAQDAGLSEHQIHIFKESITVLLNETLAARGLPLDSGYSDHRSLRDEWSRMWNLGDRRFDTFLPVALAFYAEHNKRMATQ